VISVGEAYPPVLRYQELLNAVFQTGNKEWISASWQEVLCDPRVLATYRTMFPQLWEENDLIVHWEKTSDRWEKTASDLQTKPETPGYIMRLFVSGNNAATERTLKSLHQILEQSLRHPYTLKVIDVVKHPDRAEADQVSATPTLVKVWPRPIRRIVGDLDNVDKLLQVLSGLEV
jgi:circadian clock protein KaiB